MLAAPHGHISMLRQRASANSKRCQGVFTAIYARRRWSSWRYGLRPLECPTASANSKRCQEGFNTRNARMRCSFRNTRASAHEKPTHLGVVSDASVIFTSRRSRARCSARARIRAPSASVCDARRATASSKSRTLNLEHLTFNG